MARKLILCGFALQSLQYWLALFDVHLTLAAGSDQQVFRTRVSTHAASAIFLFFPPSQWRKTGTRFTGSMLG